MAADNATMTPEQAIAVLGERRDYREQMTRRAAGVLWIIWGMAMAGIGLFSQVFFLGEPASGWPDILSIALFGSAGALASNAVWRSHALERDPAHSPWVAWVAGIGVPIAIGTLVYLSNEVPIWDNTTMPGFMLAPLMLLGSGGALTIALLQRRHVPALWGYIGAGLLFALFFVARHGGFERTPWMDTAGNAALSIVNLVVFCAIGALHIRRG